jgi:hypothetical protein
VICWLKKKGRVNSSCLWLIYTIICNGFKLQILSGNWQGNYFFAFKVTVSRGSFYDFIVKFWRFYPCRIIVFNFWNSALTQYALPLTPKLGYNTSRCYFRESVHCPYRKICRFWTFVQELAGGNTQPRLCHYLAAQKLRGLKMSKAVLLTGALKCIM